MYIVFVNIVGSVFSHQNSLLVMYLPPPPNEITKYLLY